MGIGAEEVNSAKQDGMSVRRVERLSELLLEKFLEAFRRALIGPPPFKVSPTIVWHDLGAGVVRSRPRV